MNVHRNWEKGFLFCFSSQDISFLTYAALFHSTAPCRYEEGE